MIPSIRTFLLINLLLSLTLIASFAVIGNLFLEHKEVQQHLDVQLVLKALTIQSLLSSLNSSLNKDGNLLNIEKKINKIPLSAQRFFSSEQYTVPSYETPQFLVWNAQGKIILRTQGAPLIPAKLNQGLNDLWADGQLWRVFITRDSQTGLTIAVTEQYVLRENLARSIIKDSILIMLISYPFLGVLIWIIVGRGLDSLKKVASEVRYRAPAYLEPVDLASVPAEIKPMIMELNKLFVRLQDAFRREKRFAADAAHELRTPLAALKTQAQVALNAATEEERKDTLRKVIAGVDRSTHVVQQLLTLSRMAPEAFHPDFTVVNLSKQAADVIADLVPEALEKNTEIELIAPPVALILGDGTSLSILIRNLVDNAVRYTEKNSTVKVYIVEETEYLILKVVDNGPGIPEELRERVFERFFRVLGSAAPGSGLGLGIVQQIAELHRAKISLRTPESGKGLEVNIAFPKSK